MKLPDDLEDTWTCDDGGVYTIRVVDDKIIIHGEKHKQNASYENNGIGLYTAETKKIQVIWKDSIFSHGSSEAKNIQQSTITVIDDDILQSDGINDKFPKYGNLNRVKEK